MIWIVEEAHGDQEFISAPLFLRGYVDPHTNCDLLLSIDALTICCFQILATYLTRRIPTFSALTLGLLISSLAWLIVAGAGRLLGWSPRWWWWRSVRSCNRRGTWSSDGLLFPPHCHRVACRRTGWNTCARVRRRVPPGTANVVGGDSGGTGGRGVNVVRSSSRGRADAKKCNVGAVRETRLIRWNSTRTRRAPRSHFKTLYNGLNLR